MQQDASFSFSAAGTVSRFNHYDERCRTPAFCYHALRGRVLAAFPPCPALLEC
jgi:hypothetical protein